MNLPQTALVPHCPGLRFLPFHFVSLPCCLSVRLPMRFQLVYLFTCRLLFSAFILFFLWDFIFRFFSHWSAGWLALWFLWCLWLLISGQSLILHSGPFTQICLIAYNLWLEKKGSERHRFVHITMEINLPSPLPELPEYLCICKSPFTDFTSYW